LNLPKNRKIIVVIAVILLISISWPILYSQSFIYSNNFSNRLAPGFIAQDSAGVIGSMGPSMTKEAMISEPMIESTVSIQASNTNIIPRSIIYTGWMSLETDDIDLTINKIKQVISSSDGYVDNISVDKSEKFEYGYITVRVPQDQFSNVVQSIENLGELKNKNISNNDITDQLFDLKIRIENAKATEARFLQILDKAVNISDILQIEQELNRIRTDIEILEGHINNLNNRVAYSSLTINVSKTIEDPLLPGMDFFEAIRQGLNAMVILIQFIIGSFIALLPFIAILIIYRIYRRRKSSK
tara:strand:- start:69 stop:968 length:900 start_codon:yes stop_codon:yes gene_type:complete